jgi:hypothetical protein
MLPHGGSNDGMRRLCRRMPYRRLGIRRCRSLAIDKASLERVILCLS